LKRIIPLLMVLVLVTQVGGYSKKVIKNFGTYIENIVGDSMALVDANGDTVAMFSRNGWRVAGAYSFPATDGSPNYILKTNGSGVLSWAVDAGGGGGLTYFTEADDNDTSVFTATGPNTTVGFDDDMTMQGNDIFGAVNISADTVRAAIKGSSIDIITDNDTTTISDTTWDFGQRGGMKFANGDILIENIGAPGYGRFTLGNGEFILAASSRTLVNGTNVWIASDPSFVLDSFSYWFGKGLMGDFPYFAVDSGWLNSNWKIATASVADEAADLSDTSGVNLQELVDRIDTSLVGHEVDTNSTSLLDGYVLKYNLSSTKWEPAVDATGGSSDTSLVVSEAAGGDAAFKWSSNADTVIVTDGSANELLFYHDGGQWVIDGGEGLTKIDSLDIGDMKFRGSGNLISGVDVLSVDTIQDVDHLDFTPVSIPSHSEGRVFYDDATNTLAYYNDETEMTVCLGRCLVKYVRNNTGSTILKGRAVYQNGGIPQLPTVALAKADNVNTAKVIGLAGHDIETGTNGYVVTAGEVRDINVNQTNFTDGDSLSVSADTAGAWVVIQPPLCLPVGWVDNANASTGKIWVSLNHSIIDTNTVFGLDTYVSLRITDSLDSYFDTLNVVDTIQAMMHRLFDTVATDGFIHVANGTKFNSVAMSGDVSIDNAGVTTVEDVPADVVLLNEIGDPDGNTSIGLGSNNIVWNFANPASSGFEINATGAFSGDLVHIHQHTGNVGAVTLVEIEGEDADILPLHVVLSPANDTVAHFEGGAVFVDSLESNGEVRTGALDVTGNITVSGTVDGVDVAAIPSTYETITEVAKIGDDTANYQTAYDSSQFDNLRSDEQAVDVDSTGTDIAAALADRANVHDTLTRSFSISAIDDTFDWAFWMTPKAITIIAASGVCFGGTNVVGVLMEYDADAANPAVCNSSDWTFTTGEERTTSVDNPTIDAGDYLGWKTTSVSGGVTFFTLTFEYTVD